MLSIGDFLPSIEPRLSVLDFVSQLWRKVGAVRQNPEQRAWVRGYSLPSTYDVVNIDATHVIKLTKPSLSSFTYFKQKVDGGKVTERQQLLAHQFEFCTLM